MTLNLAQTSVAKSQPSVTYGANLFIICIVTKTWVLSAAIGSSKTHSLRPVLTA